MPDSPSASDENSADAARTTRPKPRVNKELRKAEYLRAAARTFLAKGAAASMQDIADAAGAPKPVFYRIYPSRAELIDALFQHVHDTILKTQQGKWDGYGWALRVLYAEAKQEPDIFIVVLKVFHGDPNLQPWREKLYALIHKQSTRGFFQPSPGAPPGAEKRAILAAKSLNSTSFDTLVAWLENTDGLTDEQRFTWWGRIIREWHKATREAYQLNGPDHVDADGPAT